VLCTGSNLARHSTTYARTVGAARRQAVRGEELYRTAPEHTRAAVHSHAAIEEHLYKTPLFEFPYVCPEPVLAKASGFHYEN
jgi:hypothetical protein